MNISLFLKYIASFSLLENINFNNYSVNLTQIVPNLDNGKITLIGSTYCGFPRIVQIGNSSEYFLENGGIPQHASYSLMKTKIHDQLKHLHKSYSNYVIFDMEDWSPIWELTSSLYQNNTVSHVQNQHPTIFPNWNNSMLWLRAKESWELSSMNVMIQAIQIVRDKFPLAKIGYYGFPGMPYWCNGYNNCPLQRMYNTQMMELWKQVDVLLPSIYMPYNSTGNIGVYLRNIAYVHRKISEAIRLSRLFPNKSFEIIPYTWHRYHDPPNDLIGYNELTIEYGYTYSFPEVNGVILWSNEGNSKWVNETIGWFTKYANYFKKF